jgi:uncharacterized membrane protein YjfL (UPF0719 family)
MVDLSTVSISLAYVACGLAALLVAKVVQDVLTPYKINEHLTEHDNPALGITLAGYLAGVVIIFLGAVVGPDLDGELTFTELATDIGGDLLYVLGGVLALNVGRVVIDRLVLRGFSTAREIVEHGNVGTAAVEAGAYVATALVVAGAVYGEGGGPLTACVFFALGQLVLVVFGSFYQWLTRYDVHAEIEKGNVAAGIAMGLGMVAIGIVLFGATAHDFVGWQENLLEFGQFSVLGGLLLAVLRRVTDVVLLPGTTLAHEIARDQNNNAAWIEGVVNVGMAAIVFFMI